MQKKLNVGKIEQLMRKKGMNQGDFAEKIGVSRQWISQVFMRGSWSPGRVYELADVLGVSVDEITEA